MMMAITGGARGREGRRATRCKLKSAAERFRQYFSSADLPPRAGAHCYSAAARDPEATTAAIGRARLLNAAPVCEPPYSAASARQAAALHWFGLK